MEDIDRIYTFVLSLDVGVRRRAAGLQPVLTEEEQALLDLNDGLSLSEINPLHEEIKNYINAVRALPVEVLWAFGRRTTQDIHFLRAWREEFCPPVAHRVRLRGFCRGLG